MQKYLFIHLIILNIYMEGNPDNLKNNTISIKNSKAILPFLF